MRHLITIAITASICLNTACQKKGEVTHFRDNKSNQPQVITPDASAVKQTPSAPYTWTLPDGWSAQAASGMRLATIIIPTPQGELNASITEFGGDLAGNVNRWRGQVGLASLAEPEAMASLNKTDTPLGQGYIVTLINPASPENAMLAAIIPRPSGTSVFIKVTGSADQLKSIEAPFRAFTQSLSQ